MQINDTKALWAAIRFEILAQILNLETEPVDDLDFPYTPDELSDFAVANIKTVLQRSGYKLVKEENK